MSIFVVHQNLSRSDDRGFVFLPDRFNWLAFFLPPIWALSRRLWLVFVLIVAAIIILNFFAMVFFLPMVWIYLLGSWWLAMAANSIEGLFLARQGWQVISFVEASDLVAAEEQFFGTYQPRPANLSTKTNSQTVTY